MKSLITILTLLPFFISAQDYSYTVYFPQDFRAIDTKIITKTSKDVWSNYMNTYNLRGKKSERTKIESKNDIVRYYNVVIGDIAKTSPFDVQARFGNRSVTLSYFFYPSGYSKGLPYDTTACARFAHAYLLNCLAEIEGSRFDAQQKQHQYLSHQIEQSKKVIAKEEEKQEKSQRRVDKSEKIIGLETKKIQQNEGRLKSTESVIRELNHKIASTKQ